MSWVDKFFGEKDKAKPGSEVPRPKSPSPNTPKRAASATEIRNREMEEYYNGKTTVEEIDYQFKQMDELPDITPLAEEFWPKGSQDPMVKTQPSTGTVVKAEVQQSNAEFLKDIAQPNNAVLPNGAAQPNNAVSPNGTFAQPKGVNKPKEAKYVYTPRYLEEDTKLTVILVENTEDVVKQKDKLEQIVKGLVVSGLVCVINYGKVVREGKIVDAKDFDCRALLYEEFAGNNACLFDALIALENVVKKNYKDIIDETKYKRKRIKSIDIIGIGRCVDNCSISSIQLAIESFSKVVKHRDITSKYFCLSEENFIQAATIGFHSIGAISRNYM